MLQKANRRASPSTHRTPYGRVHHGVPNVRSSPRVHGSGHRRPPRHSPCRCGLHGGPRRFTRRLRRVVHRSSGGHRLVPPSEPLPQGGDGCPAPLPRVAVRPFRTPFRDRRQEMCGQMRHTILAHRRLIGHPSGGFSQTRRFKGPAEPRCSSRQQAGSFHTVAHRALSSASIHSSRQGGTRSPASRDWKWRTADWHPVIRHRSGLKIPPRPLSAAVEPSAKGAPSLLKSAAGGPGMPVPPISFPPFGNPPFLIPPSNSNPPKGGKPQGALARRPLWRG